MLYTPLTPTPLNEICTNCLPLLVVLKAEMTEPFTHYINGKFIRFSLDCRDYPLLLIEEYMNHGDLLGVLKDSRPNMPLIRQLTYAYHVADGMDYLANTL